METWNLFFKSKLLANVRVHKTFFSKLKGLMFSSPLKKQEGIILVLEQEDLLSIHMLFVFFPIDVLWLDKTGRVVDKKENIQPFSLSHTPRKPAQYIVELPAGSCKNIEIGNKIRIKK